MFTADQLMAAGLAANGSPAMRLLEYGCVGALRPWIATDEHGRKTGRAYITINTGRKNKTGDPVYENRLITNSPALLTRDDWLRVDRETTWAAKQRLKLWGIIYGRNPYNVPNGMGTIAIQHTVADGDMDATISMDGVRRAERARPFQDRGIIPLPITHADGRFTLREVMVSRNGNLPLDTTAIRLSARRVAEVIEQLCIGTLSYTYASGTIYGLTNFPSRSTKIMMVPTDGSWTPVRAVTEILAMLATLTANKFYGPYALFYSNGWDSYLDADYNTTSQTYTGDTLRTRLQKIPAIQTMQQLDYLTDYQMILVQMTSDVIEGVQGLPPTTVQWEEQGGMELAFKHLAIQLPRVRADINGVAGIVHATGFAGGTSTTTTTTTTT